jgi:septum formation inhibitor-activating ATPase MinD
MKVGIMQPYFFPYIGYWQLIKAVDKFVIYDDVNFIKRGWINRNKILNQGEGKFINLLVSQASQNKLINELEVLKNLIHNKKLLKTLESCYRRAPYYADVLPVIESIITQDEGNLARYLEFFKLINSKGISDYLTTEIPLKDAIKESKNNMLHFMLAGFQKVNFNTLLDSARCREMFANLKEVYDYILIDSPAISDSSDALVLAKYADTSIFVVQAGKLDRKKVIRCKESLERVNPNILGVIVNKSGKYF